MLKPSLTVILFLWTVFSVLDAALAIAEPSTGEPIERLDDGTQPLDPEGDRFPIERVRQLLMRAPTLHHLLSSPHLPDTDPSAERERPPSQEFDGCGSTRRAALIVAALLPVEEDEGAPCSTEVAVRHVDVLDVSESETSGACNCDAPGEGDVPENTPSDVPPPAASPTYGSGYGSGNKRRASLERTSPERDRLRTAPTVQNEAWFFRGLRSQDHRVLGLADRFGGALSVNNAYFREDPRAPAKFAQDGLQRDAVDVKLQAALPAGLTTETQVAFSAFESQGQRVSDERRNRLLHFKLSGDATYFHYGAEYRSVGQGVRYQLGSNMRLDQDATEVWAERAFGWMKLKAVMAEFSDNVEQDFRRPRTSMAMSGLVSSVTIPLGFTVSLSYLQGTSLRRIPGGIPQEGTVQQFGTSLYYWHPTWEISASTNFLPSRDRLDPSRETSSFYHDLSLTYRPTDSLWISPYVSYSEDQFKWSGTRSQNPMAMLSVTWATFVENINLNMFAMYSRNRSTDGWMDATMTLFMNSLVYDLGGKHKGHTTLSFDVLYTSYLDTVYRQGSYREFIARLLLNLMSF